MPIKVNIPRYYRLVNNLLISRWNHLRVFFTLYFVIDCKLVLYDDHDCFVNCKCLIEGYYDQTLFAMCKR